MPQPAPAQDPDFAHVGILCPIMVRLADEGVPLNAIARATQLPLPVVHATITDALQSARLLDRPPNEWPQKQPPTQRSGRKTPFHDYELITALQHRYDVTRQQALLLAVLLKKECASKEILHAAAQQIHAPDRPETCPKLIDVVIYKLRRRLIKHGYSIVTIWAGGYYLPANHRRNILAEIGFTVEPEK